jgi:hypothetical protein
MQELIYKESGIYERIRSVSVRVSLEEKEASVLALADDLKLSVSVRVSLEEKEASVLALALTLALFQYPERDLNPHNRNGHRILSPACLPFHHPGENLSDSLASLQSCRSGRNEWRVQI